MKQIAITFLLSAIYTILSFSMNYIGRIFVLLGYKPVSPQVKFAHPERIRYDGSCMTIDGKDLFIYIVWHSTISAVRKNCGRDGAVLVKKRGPSIRWSLHWYDAVCSALADEQITRKPIGGKGIILIQIENEYNYHGCEGKEELLKAMEIAPYQGAAEIRKIEK